MEIEVLTIVLVDHDQQMYFKLNPNSNRDNEDFSAA